jgi:23S rRNA (cytosine1962-C5)-methyltransferase
VAAELEERIRRAYQARSGLHADTEIEAYRLFHGYGEGGPGLLIDRYGDVLLIENRGAEASEVETASKVLQEFETFSCIVLKERGTGPRALLGTLPNEAVAIRENGLSYWIETWAPRNPGLYLDARPARDWLQGNCQDRRILNLYSYAGSLGVAAMAGGARGVTHVDTQKRALKRCQDNHKLNGQRTDERDVERLDVEKMLRKAQASKRMFGGIIVDPPPPGVAASDPVATPVSLAPALAKVAEPGAWILCFFHHDPRSWEELEAAMGNALNRSHEVIWRGRSGPDFPESSPERDLRLSAMLLP